MTQNALALIKRRVNLPDGKLSAIGRPCFDAACYGNGRIGELLNYFVYEASIEAERQKLPEDCKVIKLARTHEDILQSVRISEKTLITYLKQLKIWGYVLSQPYHIEYIVNLEAVNDAILKPPELVQRRRVTKQTEKGCKSTTLQPNECEQGCKVVELQEKVVSLQLQVEDLQHKVVSLQSLVVTLQPYNLAQATLEQGSNGNFDPPRLLEIQRDVIETERENSDASVDTSASPAHTSLSPSEIVVDEQSVPVTYAQCLTYLQQRSISTEGLDAVQVMTTARNLYVKQYPHTSFPIGSGSTNTDSEDDTPVIPPLHTTLPQKGRTDGHCRQGGTPEILAAGSADLPSNTSDPGTHGSFRSVAGLEQVQTATQEITPSQKGQTNVTTPHSTSTRHTGIPTGDNSRDMGTQPGFVVGDGSSLATRNAESTSQATLSTQVDNLARSVDALAEEDQHILLQLMWERLEKSTAPRQQGNHHQGAMQVEQDDASGVSAAPPLLGEQSHETTEALGLFAGESTPPVNTLRASMTGGSTRARVQGRATGKQDTLTASLQNKTQQKDKTKNAGGQTENSGPPLMPSVTAKWPSPETVVAISEALRERCYTDKQRETNLKKATQMFREFPALTREQFTTIFQEMHQWWKEHDAGLVTIGDMMAKDKGGTIRLQKSLERLELKQQHKSNGNGNEQSAAPTNVTVMYRNKSDELRAQREKYAAQGGY